MIDGSWETIRAFDGGLCHGSFCFIALEHTGLERWCLEYWVGVVGVVIIIVLNT